eukprot:Clim_evm38s202 gene=Clim_evmTU38s202
MGAQYELNQTSFWMLANLLSSLSIVMVNKACFVSYGFNYPTVLTCVHFTVTAICLKVCAEMGVFKVKTVAIPEVLNLCVSFCGFVVLTNLSLRYNSVGFYQLAKVMTTPVIIAVQMYHYKKKFSREILLSLAPIIVGVILNGSFDIQLNLIGTFYAAAGVLSTSFYQIWVGTKQKDLDMTSMQLLYYQAPISALMLVVAAPFFDQILGPEGLLNYQFTTGAVFTVLLSGLISFAVNLSIFMVIGKTSPVSYNVLGHFKLCVVLLGGWIVFQEQLNYVQMFGTAIALGGIFWYTHLKLQEQEREKRAKEKGKMAQPVNGSPTPGSQYIRTTTSASPAHTAVYRSVSVNDAAETINTAPLLPK